MKCVILAAGLGSRLRAQSDAKPLTPVAGKPLIEHVIAAAAAAGAREFTIVTGHAAERIEAAVASIAPRLGVTIACARTEDWNRPNGHSVLTGAAAIDGPYLLLMSDHLFEPEIARRLLAGARADAGLTLAVDRRLDNPWLDMDDATKVETVGEGEIRRIGKTLARFDAIDTGIFLATPALAAAVRAAIDAGAAGSLSEGVQHLADRHLAWTVDSGAGRWLDVDDGAALALAQDFVMAA
jgi:1L-myo-inositol 1-phosphate cytidylyltransferase